MAQMTADQLATDILARQGRDVADRREANLTVRQAEYLFDLCRRAGYLDPVQPARGSLARSGRWELQSRPNGCAVLRTWTPSAPTTDDAIADQADALIDDYTDVLLDTYEAWHLEAIIARRDAQRLATTTPARAAAAAIAPRARTTVKAPRTPKIGTDVASVEAWIANKWASARI